MPISELTIGDRVKAFYEEHPFPAFDPDKFRSAADLEDIAGPLAHFLDCELPPDQPVLEVGCGTGQLTCFLARNGRQVLGIDFSDASLAMGRSLAERLSIDSATFLHHDLMQDDYLPAHPTVLALGVLHHTADPWSAFKRCMQMARPGARLAVGFYHPVGRREVHRRKASLNRKQLPNFSLRRSWVLPLVGRDDGDESRIDSWFWDQYLHPHEACISLAEALRMFNRENVQATALLPTLTRGAPLPPHLWSDTNHPIPSFLLSLREGLWAHRLQSSGGFFFLAGKRRN